MITWNNLATAFLPSADGGATSDGVFKKAWAGLFFGNSSATTLPTSLATGAASRAADDPACGRFAADVCRAYLSIASTGAATPADIALLERSSPAGVLDRIHAPTLLIQGEADSLFPLSEADANARDSPRTARPYGGLVHRRPRRRLRTTVGPGSAEQPHRSMA